MSSFLAQSKLLSHHAALENDPHQADGGLDGDLTADPQFTRHIATEENNREARKNSDKLLEASPPKTQADDGKPLDWVASGLQAGQVSFSANYLQDG